MYVRSNFFVDDYYRARRYWNQYDPILITEIVYSVIQIFTWWSIFYILQVFHGVALLTVSIHRWQCQAICILDKIMIK